MENQELFFVKDLMTKRFIVNMIRLGNIKKSEIETMEDLNEIDVIINKCKSDYVKGEYQYTILKNFLEKQTNCELSKKELYNYCLLKKTDFLFNFKKMSSIEYFKDSLLKGYDVDFWTKQVVVQSLFKLTGEQKKLEDSKRFLSDEDIEEMRKLNTFFNYYSCMDGIVNYVALKNMGIEEFFDNQNDDKKKQHTYSK